MYMDIWIWCAEFIDDLINASTDATTELTQLKASYGGDRKIYTSVEEFMMERQMLIDLVVSRRHIIQVSKNNNVNDKFISSNIVYMSLMFWRFMDLCEHGSKGPASVTTLRSEKESCCHMSPREFLNLLS